MSTLSPVKSSKLRQLTVITIGECQLLNLSQNIKALSNCFRKFRKRKESGMTKKKFERIQVGEL